MEIESIHKKLKDCKNHLYSAQFNDEIKGIVNEILNPGEYVDFNGFNVDGEFYEISFNGMKRENDGSIKFNANFDCGYGHKEFFMSNMPKTVIYNCVRRLVEKIPELAEKREHEKWWGVYKWSLKNNFKFWQRQGKNIYESLKMAVDEVSKLKHDPRVPHGEEINKKVLDSFLVTWRYAVDKLEDKVTNGTYNEEDIRICDSCGLPMSEGYYLCGEYACDEECCLDCYHGDKEQMEEDLSHAEEDCSETYYTEWDSIFFDD